MILNRELSEQLAVDVEARQKECWRNSVMAFMLLDAATKSSSLPAMGAGSEGINARYVEGLLLLPDFLLLIQHGWLVVNGQIVDVTLLDTRAEHYVEVFSYTQEEVLRYIGQHRDMPFFAHLPLGYTLMAQAEIEHWRKAIEFETEGEHE